jgi:hypothetical protein
MQMNSVYVAARKAARSKPPLHLPPPEISLLKPLEAPKARKEKKSSKIKDGDESSVARLFDSDSDEGQVKETEEDEEEGGNLQSSSANEREARENEDNDEDEDEDEEEEEEEGEGGEAEPEVDELESD